jgi:hypothetical protein
MLMQPAVVGVEGMMTLATRWYWTKRRGVPGRPGAMPDDPDDAAAKLEEDSEEPE